MARGGIRCGSGRPKGAKNKSAMVIETPSTNDPKEFLLSIMNDVNADPRARIDAAKCLMPFCHPKLGEGGKKDQKQDAAKAASQGKFAPKAPPKLVINNR